MKFRFALFIWLSSLILALLLGLFSYYGIPGWLVVGYRGESTIIVKASGIGLRVLAVTVLIGSTVLYLLGKKLSRRLYAGIFALLIMVSLLMATWVVTYY